MNRQTVRILRSTVSSSVMGRTLSSVCVIAAMAFALFGCGGSGGTTSQSDPTFFFVNSSPDSGSLHFLLNDVLKGDSVPYLGDTTDFEEVEFIEDADGGYTALIENTTTGFEYDAENLVLPKDSHSVFMALGLEDFGTEFEKRLRLFRIPVDRDAPIGNKVRLYIVHAFSRKAGLQTPHIAFQNPGDNPQYRAGNIPFGKASEMLIDSGPSDWIARREDTTADVIYATKNVNLPPGSVYLVLVTGIEDEVGAAEPQIVFLQLSTT